jgi:cysteinyl-tRNA synthetase
MNDDFNTPILIAQLFEGVRFINILKDGKETLNTEDLKSFEKMTDFEVLGMEDEKISDSSNDKLEGTVNMLIEMKTSP